MAQFPRRGILGFILDSSELPGQRELPTLVEEARRASASHSGEGACPRLLDPRPVDGARHTQQKPVDHAAAERRLDHRHRPAHLAVQQAATPLLGRG